MRAIAYALRSSGFCPPQAYEGNYGWSRGHHWAILYYAHDSKEDQNGAHWLGIVSRCNEPRQSASPEKYRYTGEH